MRILLFVCLLSSFLTEAMPTNPIVMAGDVSFSSAEGVISVQCSDASIIHWNDFSIAAHETTCFVQPNSLSAVLNRVTGNFSSEILGRLESNGRVLLINPNGILISKDAVIDTGSFWAAAFDLSDRDFLEGRFLEGGGNAIVVQGHVSARFGDVTLLGQMINIEGAIDATEQIVAIGSKETLVTGRLKAPRVELLGEIVRLENEGSIDVTPGGKAYLGGGDHSKVTFVGAGALIDANGALHGDGGEVIIWSDGETHFYGTVLARGGEEGGDGGFVEVSGMRSLKFEGKTDRSAPRGKAGTLLLDPTDIDIQNVFATTGAFAGGNYVPATASDFIERGTTVVPNTLLFELNLGNVIINTFSGFGSPGNISINDTFTYNLSNSLTLIADGQIFINGLVSNMGTGDLFLTANGDITIGSLTSAIPTGLTTEGTIDIQSVTGNFFILGGNIAGASAIIGGNEATFVTVPGIITLQGGNGPGATATMFTADVQNNSSIISCGGNLSVLSGTGGAAAIQLNFDPTIVNVGGNLIITSNTGGAAQIFSFEPVDINVTGNLQVTGMGGGISTNSFFTIDVGGNADLNAATIQALNGSSSMIVGGNVNMASDGMIDSFINVNGNLLLRAGGDFTMTGQPPFQAFITTTGGNLDMNVRGSLTMNNDSRIEIPPDLFPFNQQIVCGIDLILNSNATIQNNSPGGITTLVCDDLFPAPPQIGPGIFFLSNAATITTMGGPLRIFTALRGSNSINNSINGNAFNPNPLYSDSNQERWGIYFFNPFFGGPGFTIFYKDTPSLIVALTPFPDLAELFRQLHPFEEYIRLALGFRVFYDKQSPSRKGVVDSFDLFTEDDFFIRKRTYPHNNIDNRIDPTDYFERE